MPCKIKRLWVTVLTRYTKFIKAKFTTDSYQCSLFHLHKIHLYTCSYRIPWYCYKHHYHYSCVLRWHTRRYLKQQKESNWKTFNWNGVVTKLCADIWCLPNLLLFYCLTHKSYKSNFRKLTNACMVRSSAFE